MLHDRARLVQDIECKKDVVQGHSTDRIVAGKAQEQNDRNSFFQSLRSKQPPGTHPPLSSAQSSSVASGLSELELGALSRQPSVDVPEAAAQSPHANGQARPRDQQSAAVESLPEAAVAALCNGNGAHQVMAGSMP